MTADKKVIYAKRRARKLALQALYQWLMSGDSLFEIETQFHVNNNMEKVDCPYFSKLLHEIPKNIALVEAHFEPYLDRSMEALNPVERTVLRIGAFELACCPDLPYKVVLDESISLSKAFGSKDGHRYVNAVLNQVACKLRLLEVQLEKKNDKES